MQKDPTLIHLDRPFHYTRKEERVIKRMGGDDRVYEP